jgi:hypothetical protein
MIKEDVHRFKLEETCNLSSISDTFGNVLNNFVYSTSGYSHTSLEMS